MESDRRKLRKHVRGSPRAAALEAAGALRMAGATLAIAACLFGVDLALGYRGLVAEEPGESIADVHVAHPRLGWTLRPGSVGRHRREGIFDVAYRIGGDGLRHVENRGPARSRLWIFGDSFAFGHGVADRETFASVLASRELPPGMHVANAGVMGYGIAQEVQRLVELQGRIAPGDLVLFAPLSTDLERSLDFFRYPSRHLFRASKGRVERFPDWRDGRLVAAALDTPWSRAKALLYHARYTGRGIERIHHLLVPPRAVEETHAMLAHAREIAEGRGARFLLLFLPHPEECLSGRYRVDVSSFEFPDLMGSFPRDREGVDAIRLPEDGHWNARGHALAAAAVARVLREGGFLEARDGNG
jgi:hypothetical protein